MYETEVTNGMELLDRIFKGEDWRVYINTEVLDLRSLRNCVGGQLAVMIAPPKEKSMLETEYFYIEFDYFDEYVGEMYAPDYEPEDYEHWSEAYGFALPFGEDYDELTATWKRLMDERGQVT